MYCKYCGEEIPADSTFCPMCGEKLSTVIREEKNEAKLQGTSESCAVKPGFSKKNK